jgi:hypothetical protein
MMTTFGDPGQSPVRDLASRLSCQCTRVHKKKPEPCQEWSDHLASEARPRYASSSKCERLRCHPQPFRGSYPVLRHRRPNKRQTCS